MSGDLPILMRGITKRDINLVTHSWLTNARKTFLVKGVSNEVYYSHHHKILEHIIPRSTVMLACDPEDPDTVYGWICCEVVNDVLVIHYIYVKGMFKAQQVGHDDAGEPLYKGWGMGTKLLMEILKHEDHLKGIVYTHETVAGRKFLQRLYRKDLLPHDPEFNPYLLFLTLPGDWSS